MGKGDLFYQIILTSSGFCEQACNFQSFTSTNDNEMILTSFLFFIFLCVESVIAIIASSLEIPWLRLPVIAAASEEETVKESILFTESSKTIEEGLTTTAAPLQQGGVGNCNLSVGGGFDVAHFDSDSKRKSWASLARLVHTRLT